MGVAAALVHHLDPTGPVIGLFLVTAFAPLRLPRTPAVLVAAGSAALFSLVLAVDQPRPLVSVAVVLVGAGFFFLFGTLMRGEREQRLRADDLVRQLEASRAGELRAAAEGERIRLAREIHDVLAHTLSGLIVQLGGARLAAEQPGTDPALREAVVRSHELARAGLAEAREAVSALRGASPGPEAVPDLVAEHEGLSGGPCRLVVEGDPRPLGVEARRAVYRVVQESLSNVRKHAPGADVDVRLTWGSDSVVVEIRDEGGGPDPLPGEGIGAGLDGMRERAALAGGTLEAQRTATGFRVRLCMPVTTGGAR
jgi:signal transduction histidine kinase